jgi:hypothetical protein
VRRLLLTLLVAVLAATPSASGVIGGSAVDVRDAPWSALVLHRAGAGGSLCTGAILDATHVVTAAHCVVEAGVVFPASTMFVRAGVTNAATPTPTDSMQERPVGTIRVHRGYAEGDRSGADDVAVLVLATPLDLGGPTAAPVALPSPGFRWRIGDGVKMVGYGLKALNSSIDGTLNGMTATLVDQGECLRPSDDTANGVLLCAFSGTSSPCSGDSGSALVLPGPPPVLIGVTRAAACRANTGSSYADVSAPEILQFIQGNDNPPSAPRATSPTTLEQPTAVMQVGQTVTCRPGGWTGSPTFAYEFREGASDTVLRSGPSPVYRLGFVDAGRKLFCRVLATNDGGTTFDESAIPFSTVQTQPELSVQPTSARPGGTATVRVKLVEWVRPFGKVDVCVRLSPRVGGKVCRTATPAGATPTVVMQLKLKATAPIVRARAAVSARAQDGRTAARPAFVNVRRR